MQYVILEKTKSKLDIPHPNFVEVGNRSIRGYLLEGKLKIGEQLYLYDRHGRVISWTSKVLKFTSSEIETNNSIYTINYETYCEDCNEIFFNNIVINEEHCCPKCFSDNITKLDFTNDNRRL